MKYLWSDEGRQALEKLMSVKTLYAFDFDGTLCPIVETPKAAKLTARTQELISNLAKVAPIAIVSGRSIDDLRSRVSEKSVFLVGNHGGEGLPGQSDEGEREAICLDWFQQSLGWNQDQLREMCVFFENKKLSLSLHYRASPDQRSAKKLILDYAQRLTPTPRIIFGKFVVNLLPGSSPDKGQAIQKILSSSNYDHGLFVGDDMTDEKVFELRDPRILGVHIEKKRGSLAPFFLKSQEEVDHLIQYLINPQTITKKGMIGLTESSE